MDRSHEEQFTLTFTRGEFHQLLYGAVIWDKHLHHVFCEAYVPSGSVQFIFTRAELKTLFDCTITSRDWAVEESDALIHDALLERMGRALGLSEDKWLDTDEPKCILKSSPSSRGPSIAICRQRRGPVEHPDS